MAIPIGDSDYGRWRDLLEIETTKDQDLACLFLERHGQRFLVDFGIENAIWKANDILGLTMAVEDDFAETAEPANPLT